MAVKKLRIILDTNWYISATISKNSRRIIYNLLNNNRVVVLFSEELLVEYQSVIGRDKFKKIVSVRQALRFMNLMIPKLENIIIKTTIQGSRDVNDNYLLSLSVDGKADYLITGDNDLLILENIENTRIIRLNDFLSHLSKL